MALKDDAKAKLDSLQLQLQGLWKRETLVHPKIAVKFTVSNPNSDNDGMLVSLMDLLQIKGAKVIFNDSIEFCNGGTEILPASICAVGEECVELFITPQGSEDD